MSDASSCSLVFRGVPAYRDRKPLRAFIHQLSRDLGGGRPFDVLVTSDAAMRGLNRAYLAHDHSTDVLSFPSMTAQGPLGDIAISLPIATEQAARLGHTVDQELRVLLLHGVLHLAGFDHENDGGRMRRMESTWRKRYGLPTTLTQRAAR
jgi:probable rRNA maturation factor